MSQTGIEQAGVAEAVFRRKPLRLRKIFTPLGLSWALLIARSGEERGEINPTGTAGDAFWNSMAHPAVGYAGGLVAELALRLAGKAERSTKQRALASYVGAFTANLAVEIGQSWTDTPGHIVDFALTHELRMETAKDAAFAAVGWVAYNAVNYDWESLFAQKKGGVYDWAADRRNTLNHNPN